MWFDATGDGCVPPTLPSHPNSIFTQQLLCRDCEETDKGEESEEHLLGEEFLHQRKIIRQALLGQVMEDGDEVIPYERLVVFIKQRAVAGIHERLTVRLDRMPLQEPRHILRHIRVEAGMDRVRMIPNERAIFKAGPRHILTQGDLAAALDVLPLLTLENGKLAQIVDEDCRQPFPCSPAPAKCA